MNKRDWGIEDPGETQYWYNTRTSEVEEGPQSLQLYRIGPFKTREEASHALEIVRKRARKWEEEEQAEA